MVCGIANLVFITRTDYTELHRLHRTSYLLSNMLHPIIANIVVKLSRADYDLNARLL